MVETMVKPIQLQAARHTGQASVAESRAGVTPTTTLPSPFSVKQTLQRMEHGTRGRAADAATPKSLPQRAPGNSRVR